MPTAPPWLILITRKLGYNNIYIFNRGITQTGIVFQTKVPFGILLQIFYEIFIPIGILFWFDVLLILPKGEVCGKLFSIFIIYVIFSYALLTTHPELGIWISIFEKSIILICVLYNTIILFFSHYFITEFVWELFIFQEGRTYFWVNFRLSLSCVFYVCIATSSTSWCAGLIGKALKFSLLQNTDFHFSSSIDTFSNSKDQVSGFCFYLIDMLRDLQLELINSKTGHFFSLASKSQNKRHEIEEEDEICNKVHF